jgi:hypothetical protein
MEQIYRAIERWRGKMIILREFTEKGIESFREYIHELKKDSNCPRPDLNDKPYSEKFIKSVEIDEILIFTTRMEMGKYLTNIFEEAGIRRNDVIGKKEMWTWLAYIWFDQLTITNNGKKKILEDAKYICSSDYTDYFRHYVAGAYDLYSLYGDDLAKLFLDTPVYETSDFIDSFADKQYIISHKNIVEAIYKLYWDSNSDKAKRGTKTRTRPGHTRRFTTIIKQFELTYDIYSMTPDEILELLPSEFDDWKRNIQMQLLSV